MRPTRRALALVCLCGLAVWLAVRFGARSLNAVVVPVVVALAAGVVQLFFTDRPVVHRRRLAPGFPGENRRVKVDIETDDPLPARVAEEVGDGLRTRFTGVTRSLPTTIDYDVTLDARGEQRLGPLTLVVTDVFGLWTKRFVYPKRTPVLVYPTVYDMARAGGLFGGPERFDDDRERFEELREYVAGDSLRDIHWASSAKRDDLVVMEFDATSDVTGLTVAAGATAGHDDEMAAAAASVVTELLDAGFEVALLLPDGEIERGGGEPQRERALAALARTGPGRIDHDADVRVFADANSTRVSVEGREIPFGELAVPAGEPSAADAGVAS